MSDIAISVEGLGKAYRIGLKDQIPDTIAGAVASIVRAPFRNFRRLRSLNTFSQNGEAEDIIWALKDVSFQVKQGEVIGVIGRNGAGKSTLLKILSRITEPTAGRAVINGRVASLLEVGTGFHPEMTGRENIYMNGTILGMRKKEIDGKLDEIVEFSGVEKFIDTPIKRYSSGMKVRLAFSVAAHLEPEILIIDEVLAVGDQEFQNKCLGKMQTVANQGRTVLFVSHNLTAVQSLCTRAILLQDGQLAMSGNVGEVSTFYLNGSEARTTMGIYEAKSPFSLIQRIQLLDASERNTDHVDAGADLGFEILLSSREVKRELTIRIVITTESGVRVCNCNSRIETKRLFSVHDVLKIKCILVQQRLAPGRYTAAIGVFYHGEELESADPAFAFEISATDLFGTGVLPSLHKAVYLPVAEWSSTSVAQNENCVISERVQVR